MPFVSRQEWSYTKKGPGRKHALPVQFFYGNHAVRSSNPPGTKLLKSTPSGKEWLRTQPIKHYPKYTTEWT